MSLQFSRSSPTKRILTLLFTIAPLAGIGIGLYLLYQSFSPAVSGVIINPRDNPTTKVLLKKQTPKANQLYIPSINVSVSFATDASSLETGAWWRHPENGDPETGGNFVLAAHRLEIGWLPGETVRKSPFYNIGKLRLGDKITIDYQKERYNYTISRIFTVKPNAVEIERRTDTPQLTLYSCTLAGANDGREVIIATPTRPESKQQS